ncbi:uncharacterized protein [Rutidosis leptorrhynchoides]|uniref:uncharacterized protein n=1 Tax=Rutidosis leptorrhynchoides TaxID=125765 RepID=UPI003A99A83D
MVHSLGDENSSFFHTSLNRKRKKVQITGVMHNGDWITTPPHVKEVFFNFFVHKFLHIDNDYIATPSSHIRMLSQSNSLKICMEASDEEIKNAVWSCGSNKSPGPDGFSFKFVKHFWDILIEDIYMLVRHFLDSCSNPKGYDVMFMGEWCASNATNLITILDCFFAVSNLKINPQKSLLYGVGVHQSEVDTLSSSLGFFASSPSFYHLGLPENMLSIGGRLTLIKSVLGAMGTYYFSMFKAPANVIKKLESLRASFFWGGNDNEKKIYWVKWRLILNPLEKRGLGVASLSSLNLALLYKWRWRFVLNCN